MTAIEHIPSGHCDELVQLFDATFAESLNTRLIKGGEEPIYLPAGYSGADYAVSPSHRIVFTQDYYASGLHEVAHWCVAGESRRQQVDYGYWYAPDGRSPEQQQDFELVEVKPQALEWMFSVACGRRFRVSADNLAMGLGASDSFKERIYEQVLACCRGQVNSRAERFIGTLAGFYGVKGVFDAKNYALKEL